VTLSQLFKQLGAPLANVRWSWGAVRESDSAIFLRVWQDECRTIDGRIYVLVRSKSEEAAERPGRTERMQHVAQIRRGARSYLIMCRAKDPTAVPREIAGFNDDDVFVGGELFDAGGHTWLELVERKPVDGIRPQHVGT
jgi:hypothetical protein